MADSTRTGDGVEVHVPVRSLPGRRPSQWSRLAYQPSVLGILRPRLACHKYTCSNDSIAKQEDPYINSLAL